MLNGKEISVIKVGINNQLNAKQKALLEMLGDCLSENKPFNWDSMVEFYCKNVKSVYENYDYDYDFFTSGSFRKTNERYVKHDILKAYKNDESLWSWKIKPSIRQWFATNIGSMVLKGSILALPIIEID